MSKQVKGWGILSIPALMLFGVILYSHGLEILVWTLVGIVVFGFTLGCVVTGIALIIEDREDKEQLELIAANRKADRIIQSYYYKEKP